MTNLTCRHHARPAADARPGAPCRSRRYSSREDLGGEEVPDHVLSGEPAWQGRHLQHGVLAQQFGKGIRVPVFEGGGETVEDCSLHRVVRLDRLLFGRECAGQLGPGPPQPGVDRGRSGPQQRGDLGCGPAQDVPQDQHRPLPGRPVLLCRQGESRIFGWAAEAGWQRPPPAAFQRGQAGVRGDPVAVRQQLTPEQVSLVGG
jgi:hypothetical protein